ncbi:uncharacterized protein [Typha latifolia]|uniref:uncharacterized protein n=1 Tax=Typha latifolia TaxID=4733 RepID=UPI003C2EA521
MGSAYSQAQPEDSDSDPDSDPPPAAEPDPDTDPRRSSKEKVLEQEPEILPCRAAASPLSPQLSAAGTPRLLGPTVKVWDPCHVLLPPPPASAADRAAAEVLLISHGEFAASLRPDLVGGRWPAAGLTATGERQARALAVFLKSQGVTFEAVYCSPLDRARATAALVCRELDFPDNQIQISDSLVEMSQGQWEGCIRSEIYTPEMVNLIDKAQPDFSAPSGESLRQVEFRMIEFLNRTVIRLPEKLAIEDSLIHQNEVKGFSRQSSTNSVQERDGPQWDLLYRLNRPGLQRKKSGKSRLQFVTSTENETEDDFSPSEGHKGNIGNPNTAIGIFTHAIPIKCLLAGLLDCSPMISHRICIDDSSVTVLEHSLRTGWQIKGMNDTAHLRLL